MRVGIGYDIHALKKGRKFILGGVHIPHPKGLEGHSDGDALFHAIVDATLGAMGEGDIGTFFPDTDKRYKGADSLLFVKEVVKLLKKKKLKLEHIDSTVIAEAPKLFDFKPKMRENIAKAFGVPVSRVGVKAKTSEGLGPVGKKKAVECLAVVSLKG
jgi:2-C-methyl-D-erythritol 2,4-cyclodiphosphate synthase